MAALVGIGGLAPPIARAQDDGREAIDALLQKRAAAVRARDLAAFMSTIGGDDPVFEKRQRRLFRAMRTVPLESYSLEARWDRYGDLAGLVEAARGSEELLLPVVEERYRLRGSDDEIVEDLFYTFASEGDGTWAIVSDDDIEDLGFQSARHVWDFGPIEFGGGNRFVFMGHPCGAECDLRDAVGTLADEALQRVARYWPVGDGSFAVIIPDSERELASMLQADFDLEDFVAFAVSSIDTTRGYQFVGPRIVVNPAAMAGRARADVLRILAHELLHVTTRPFSGPFVPVFVEEGFANFVGEDGAPSAQAASNELAAGGTSDGRLPADYQFMSGGPDTIFSSYQESHSAVGYFISEHGLRAFKRFYRILGRSRFQPGTTRYQVERALRATTGAGFRQFERGWASSIANP